MSPPSARRAPAPEKAGTREKLVLAAIDLMNERNSTELTLSDVAERAESNSALVKYYFGSKHGLLVAVLEHILLTTIGKMDTIISSDISPIEKLELHIAGSINLYYRYRFLNRLYNLVGQESDPDEAFEIFTRQTQPVIDRQKQILDEGLKAGLFREIDHNLFYYSLVGACDNLLSSQFSMRYVFDRNKVDRDLKKRLIQHTIDLLVGGVLLRPRADR